MKLSRFFGATNREALRQVRLALGPEALIISNRRVNGGVEILASDPTALPIPDAPGTDLVGAIDEMRGALEMRIDGLLWGNRLQRAPIAAALYQTLLALGFSTALLRAMIKRLPEGLSLDAAIQWARNELVKHLPMLDNEVELCKPGATLALVGPTGSGKTTTIAKLAVRCVKSYGGGNLVLLTTDTYRLGAYEQLKIIGQTMGVAVHVVQDECQLLKVMQSVRPDQTILLDNAGFGQRDSRIREQAAMLAVDAGGRKAQRLLVLNASSHGDTLDEVARTYRDDGGSPLAACIITKVDEAARMSAVLDTAIRYQLAISYVSNGQQVPRDLHFCRAEELVDQAFRTRRQARALYAPTEADFAALMSLTSDARRDAAESAADRTTLEGTLPGLLSVMGDLGQAPTMPELKKACDYVDHHFACAHAYALWRSHQANREPFAPSGDVMDRLPHAAPGGLDGAGQRHVLAIHDRIALKSAENGRGNLYAAVLLTDQGAALAAALQQLAFADGWQSSCGASAPSNTTPDDALLRQVEWLHDRCPHGSLVHLFRGGTRTLWRKLSDVGATWLTQCAGTTKIETESGSTRVAALARTLEYRPVADLERKLLLSDICGRAARSVVLWVGSEWVGLPNHHGATLPLQLLCVRVVSRQDGTVLKTLAGLTSLGDDQADAATLAPWLVAQSEVKTSFRYAAHHWQLLERHDADQPQNRAATAMQLGLAAWHVGQAPDAEVVRKVNRGLAGRSVWTTEAAAMSMLKLFTLKEMVL